MTLDIGRKERYIGVVKIIILHITHYLLLCTQYNEIASFSFTSITLLSSLIQKLINKLLHLFARC